MEKQFSKHPFSKTKTHRGRRVSIYFDKNEVQTLESIEKIAKAHHTTRGHVISEFMNLLALLSVYYEACVRNLNKSLDDS